MNQEPRVVVDYKNIVGEGPLWNTLDNRLYWGDITGGKLFRYDPATGDHEQIFEGAVVGGFTIQADGSLLLFMEHGRIAVLRDGQLTDIFQSLAGEEANRFNDVIADPRGRVFCGTMALDSSKGVSMEVVGRLYRLDTDGSITQLLDSVGISNGLGFTPDRKQMYYTDSPRHEIYLFDYNESTGEITNQRVFTTTPEDEGIPDGMTVDAEGYVWSARAEGGRVVRYSPDGKLDRTVLFPTANIPSSLIFGGPEMTDIYVTTIGGDQRPGAGTDAGALFQMNFGIRGVSDFHSRVGL